MRSETSKSKAAASVKVISRSAHAKKLLNKKIKINQHIKFDKDGEPVEQDGPSRNVDNEERSCSSDSDDELAIHPVSIDEFERSEKRPMVGGIKIEKAKELLRSRDKLDRKRERERIRMAHRERRLKSRRETKEDEEGKETAADGVRLAVSSSSEDKQEGQMSKSDEQDHPQSLLFSVTERDSEVHVSSSDEERRELKRRKVNRGSSRLETKRPKVDEESNEEILLVGPKRRKLEKKHKSKKKMQHEQLGSEPAPPSLMDDEELALHLLTY